MIANVSAYCVFSLLLLNIAGAKPVSNLQSLKELFEEEANMPYFGMRESEMEPKEENAERTAPSADAERPWENDETAAALAGKENAIERLLGDILSVSKRSWSRFKKGGLRSCFGVRLERIGSFSGLGC
ncbi:natriuretic peptide A-like [Brachyhypopomus gauderio]|uniref:natriuretic peptide A-like n=1 Tax=Brachyhypopomus gauderio TaxID=698409 RepID=UPI004041D1F0